ncbi:MAG: aldehyde dehydrogenase family protein [Pseudomonadota bacterium]
MTAHRCLIGGTWRPAQTGKTIDVLCPSDGKAFATIAAGGAAEIEAAVAAAHAARDGAWGRLSATERGRLLTRLGRLIADAHESLAQTEARDTGKPLSQAQADIAAAARYFEFYGGAADKVHGQTIPFLPGFSVLTLHEPFGVTGHIIPWNYPAQMIGRTLAPALAMGNAVVVKPAEDACLTPLAMAALAQEAGFPEGAINLVTGLGAEAGAALAAHPGIGFLSFTGSPETGALVQAAAARNHIGCTLELGGKSPQIVFDDADLDAVLPVLTAAIVQNGGQTCSAGARALIHRPIFDRLVGALAERFETLVAAPHDTDADLGALISARQKARVERYLDGARAPLVARGRVAADAPEGGFYVAPALYAPVPQTDPLAQEEVFGPVLSCLPFADEAEAVRLANGTPYGLVAGIWTSDGARQLRMARAVRAGQVFVNGYGAGGGIELPFGGTGRSGHGREKGFVALEEFAQLKTIVLKHG